MKKDDPHESEKYNLDWAQAKAFDLKERIAAHGKSGDPFTFFCETDPDSGEKRLKARLTNPIPWEWRGIASDAIKSLRDALDQCCLHATQRLSIDLPRGKGTHFPFGENPTDLDEVLANFKNRGRQSKDISAELHPVIRSFEPYPTGENWSGGNNALRALGRVSGSNKHEFTLTVGLHASSFAFESITGDGPFSIETPLWDSVKNETTILTCAPDTNMEYSVRIRAFTTFKSKWLFGPVDDVLANLVREVDRVITGFEREADRIIAARI
jgi:hypothetical protein